MCLQQIQMLKYNNFSSLSVQKLQIVQVETSQDSLLLSVI